MAFARRDSGYLLIFVWPFAGIAVKQVAESSVANSAWVAAVVALGLAVYKPCSTQAHVGLNFPVYVLPPVIPKNLEGL